MLKKSKMAVIAAPVFILTILWSFNLMAFNEKKAAKILNNHIDTLSMIVEYIQEYEKNDFIWWYAEKGKLKQDTGDADEIYIIHSVKNVFQYLRKEGVIYIRYNQGSGKCKFAFRSNSSESRGIMYFSGHLSEGEIIQTGPHEQEFYKTIPNHKNWYYYERRISNYNPKTRKVNPKI